MVTWGGTGQSPPPTTVKTSAGNRPEKTALRGLGLSEALERTNLEGRPDEVAAPSPVGLTGAGAETRAGGHREEKMIPKAGGGATRSPRIIDDRNWRAARIAGELLAPPLRSQCRCGLAQPRHFCCVVSICRCIGCTHPLAVAFMKGSYREGRRATLLEALVKP